MTDQDRPSSKSLLDQAKDAIDDFFGGNVEQTNERTPELVGSRMGMDQQERRDTGIDVTGVENPPYAGSAGSQALELADGEIPGTSPRLRTPDPPDSALEPF